MSDIWGAISGLVGGIMGQGQANQQADAMRMQAEMNQMSQANTNAMTINLADTAVQRRSKDLAAAGINPLMAGRIGGAETPTLQAPMMQNMGEVARLKHGNTGLQAGMQQAQNAMQIQQVNQEIELSRAKSQEALANATLKNTENKWYEPQVKSSMNLQGEQGQAAAANAEKARAETATIELMREPQVQKIIQETAKDFASTKLINVETKTATAIAKYADEKYGAEAQQAVTIAKEMAYKLKEELETKVKQEIDIRNATLYILQQDGTSKLIENLIKNRYGVQQTIMGLIGKDPFSAGNYASQLMTNPSMKENVLPPNSKRFKE